MSEYQIDGKFLITEGDVEVKLIMPLLTNPEPIGLGFSKTHIQSKLSLKKILIDKGQKSQLYYPDFVVNINGVPLIVVEAKKPGEDLQEAFREASLYAGELNRAFPKGLNPCELVLAINGEELWAGSWETAQPTVKLPVSEWILTNEDFSNFSTRYCLSDVEQKSDNARKALRTGTNFRNPLHLVGGKYFQDQTNNNAFGETISISYQHLFNPDEESEREDIVKNAYVKVTKHQAHVDPIDKLIRKKIRPAIEQSKEIEDNTKPNEILEKIKKAQNYNNQVILLIGSVGSGKSTFTTYLKEVALEKSLLNSICWVKLDLNDAPVSASEIYPWLKKDIIAQLQNLYPAIDFDGLKFINQLYGKEISSLKKGVLSLLDETSEKYKEVLVEKLLEFQRDIDLTVGCYIRELVHNRGKNLIVILDNCDKRTLEEQLLMFEVANWIKDNIKAIVFLPLRDTTFDHFRHEKPLDTVIKDLIFRINPPSLEKVIYQRIKYANRLSETSSTNYYHLPNGWKVSYPNSDELYYLKSILSSLFQNRFFKKLITGLAGRNVRKGIEVFLDFCKSGHISEKDIFKMRSSKGEYVLPNHIISRVFMRGNRIFYSGSESRVKNLFRSDPSDNLPDPFVRILILKWLNDNRRRRGPSGIQGFHRTGDVIETLANYGHSAVRVEKELLYLLQNYLLISESQDNSKLAHDDLISINPPGVIHFELLSNIDYLSSVSENVWYKTETTARQIAEDMTGSGTHQHLSIENNIKHAEQLIEYLESYYTDHFAFPNSYLSNVSDSIPLDFQKALENITDFKQKVSISGTGEIPVGSKHKGKIVNIQNYGIICEIIGTNSAGLVHVSDLPEGFDENYELGNVIDVEIKVYKPEHNKYNLVIVNS